MVTGSRCAARLAGVLPETAHRAAQATADMIIKAARTVPPARRGGMAVPRIVPAVTASGYCQM
jgi:hypothetical protein